MCSTRRVYGAAMRLVAILLVGKCGWQVINKGESWQLMLPTGSSIMKFNLQSTNTTTALPYCALDMSNLPPCRVLVTNTREIHLETLESVANLFPTDAVGLPDSCNHLDIVFDYHIVAKDKRYKSWMAYFYENMQSNNATSNNDIQGPATDCPDTQRTVGTLQLHPDPLFERPSQGYHATIEALCYCHLEYLDWLNGDPSRSCIFRETCLAAAENPRALWLSPHHQRYFIPSALPRIRQKEGTRNNKHPRHKLCVLGSTNQRDFGLLRDFMHSKPGKQARKRYQIHILGRGLFPPELEKDYFVGKYKISRAKPNNFVEFYHEAAACDGVLTLVSPRIKKQRDYFDVPTSNHNLLGAIAIVTAYRIPVVLHEDLFTLYGKHLPTVPLQTHTDDRQSFGQAMMQFLDQLDSLQKGKNATVAPENNS